MNPAVSTYISTTAPDQKYILEELRNLINKTLPSITEEIKWGRPVFSSSKDIAYLKTSKSYVTLGFFDASGFAEHPLLEGTGKNMRHIKIRKVTDIDRDLIATWLTSFKTETPIKK